MTWKNYCDPRLHCNIRNEYYNDIKVVFTCCLRVNIKNEFVVILIYTFHNEKITYFGNGVSVVGVSRIIVFRDLFLGSGYTSMPKNISFPRIRLTLAICRTKFVFFFVKAAGICGKSNSFSKPNKGTSPQEFMESETIESL